MSCYAFRNGEAGGSMKAIGQFFLVMQGLAVLLFLGLILSMWKGIFGQYSGEAFWIILGGLVVLGWVLNFRAAQRAKANAKAILRVNSNVNTGHFTRWFDRQNEWDHADHIPLHRAPGLVEKAYGGIDTIALLLKEGFSEMVRDDVMTVFGFERGARTYSELVARSRPVNIRFSLLGFMTGYKLGHDFVRR